MEKQRVGGSNCYAGEGETIDVEIWDEAELRQLSRSLSSLNFDDKRLADRALQGLFHTATNSNLSPGHRDAALSALCAFLERFGFPTRSETSFLQLNESTILQLFDIFLTKSEFYKPKPAQRLLSTATRLLSRRSEGIEKKTMIMNTVTRCTLALSEKDKSVSVKSALQTLDHFLARSITNALDIILIGSNGSSTWIPKRHSITYDLDVLNNRTNELVIRIMFWARYPDCATVVSRFIPRLFGSLDSLLGSHDRDSLSLVSRWMKPIKRVLEEDSEMLETLEKYVLPGLLSLSSTSLQDVSKFLPFNDIFGGRYGLHKEVDLQLCLLAAKLNPDLKLGPELLGKPMFNPQTAFCFSTNSIRGRLGKVRTEA